MNLEGLAVPALLVVFPLLAAVCLNLLHGKDRAVKVVALGSIVIVLALPWLTDYGVHIFGGHPAVKNVEGTNIVLAKLNLAIIYNYGPVQNILIFVLALLASAAIIIHFLERTSGVYAAMLMLGLASASAVIMADDIFNIFVFLEILTISQAALVIAIGSIKAYKTAIKYLILGGTGGSILLLGISLILGKYGLLNLSDLHSVIAAESLQGVSPILVVASGLIFVGWLFESGMVPYHIIKSDLYSKAQPSVAAFMQTQTKFIMVALWAIFVKLFYNIPTFHALILGASIFSMIFGVMMALKQTDISRLLAYVAVAQAGLVGVGLGMATKASVAASIFHAVNDTIAMAVLFLSVSIVIQVTKTTDMHKMGGLLWKKLGFTPLLCILGIFAVSGMPPFNTYQSEFRIIDAALRAGYPELSVLIILTSIATFVALMKGFYSVYLKEGPHYLKEEETTPVRYSDLAEYVMIFLIATCFGIGIRPQGVLQLVQNFVATLGVI